MSKERLEKLKHPDIKDNLGYVSGLRYLDYLWLIEQAGRVQELEEKCEVLERLRGKQVNLKNKAHDYAEELEQNKRYRKIIENVELAAQINGYDDIYNFLVKELDGESDE